MTVTSLFVYYFGIFLLFKTGMLSFHIRDIDMIYKHFRLKAVVSQWLHRCTTVGVFVWKQDGAGSNLGMFFFFFFFFFLVFVSVCVEM